MDLVQKSVVDKIKPGTWLIMLILHLIAGPMLHAQVAEMKQANHLFSEQNYKAAIPVYEEVLQNQNDREARLKLANCYRLTRQFKQALPHFEKILKSGLRSYEHYWQYGECLMHAGQYEAAIEFFNKYLRFDPVHIQSLQWRDACDLIQQVAQTKPSYELLLLPINSPNSDIAPSFYPNGLLFTSSRVDRMILQSEEEEEPKSILDLYFTEIQGKGKRVRYFKPRLLTGALNVQYHEANASYSPGEEQIAFTRHTFIEGCSRIRDEGGSLLGIWFSPVDELGWSNLEAFPYNSDSFSLTQPFLAPDGQLLLFASDQPGGEGGFDLYLSRKGPDGWRPPVNLGPEINSPGDDFFPFLHADGSLYFSSDGHPGLGKLDLFRSEFVNGWQKPQALPPPLNSTYDDFSLILTEDGRQGYFASDRPEGVGGDDLYTFLLKEPDFVCRNAQEDNYCYTFRDKGGIGSTMEGIVYRWDLGEGNIQYGEEIEHCFPGPGEYKVKLSVLDTLHQFEISQSTYPLKLSRISQAKIQGPSELLSGEKAIFDGLQSHLEGAEILAYKWDMGDGTLISGPRVEHQYEQAGVYSVSLKIIGADPDFEVLTRACALFEVRVD